MNNFTKRVLLGSGLGILAGIICAYGASTHGVPGAFDVNSAMFWSIVLNRFTIGALVGVMGVLVMHPVIKFKIGPTLRGLDVGIWISLLMATGVLIGGQADRWSGFWLTLVAGAIIGMAIDWIITKRYGQGKQLLDYQE